MITFFTLLEASTITATPVLGGRGRDRYLTDLLMQEMSVKAAKKSAIRVVFGLFSIYMLLCLILPPKSPKGGAARYYIGPPPGGWGLFSQSLSQVLMLSIPIRDCQ